MPSLKLLAEKKRVGRHHGENAKEKEPFAPEKASCPEPETEAAKETQRKPEEPELKPGANHRILVVDDNPVVLKAFDQKLKSLGFEVTTTDRTASVASLAEEKRIELIILDIHFPTGGAMEWNGFTIMQWLNHFPEVAHIPVILISGAESVHYRERSLAAGAVAFFQKPVDAAKLVATIMETLAPTFESQKGSR